MITSKLNCLVCRSDETRHAAAVGPGWKVWHCTECGFEWVDRRDLQSVDFSAQYQDYPYNRMICENYQKMRLRYLEGFRDRVLRYFRNDHIDHLSFLDVGCANGEYLATALQLGLRRAVGVEIDARAAARAAEFGRVVTDVNDLGNERFDIVQIKNVLTNIPDFNELVEQCVAHLKPLSILFLDVLNQQGLTSIVRKLRHSLGSKRASYGTLRPPCVINGFNERNLTQFLKQHDLKTLSLRFSYQGSREVPAASNTPIKIVGGLGRAMGRGTVIVADARRMAA